MGCDIHMVLERRVCDGKWVGVHNFPYYRTIKWHNFPLATDRNYDRFSALAGVRGEGPEPRGVPDDASDLARLQIEEWGSDGHSHSWLPLKDAAAIFLSTERNLDDHARKYPTEHFFNVDPASADSYRLVFWFDN